MNNGLPISEVSRIADIPKDLLRMWERRYGFPNPQRQSNGERAYSAEELEKLLLIRQLINQGMRPGKLVKMSLPELQSLLAPPTFSLDTDALTKLLKENNAYEVRQWFQQHLLAHGLRGFVHDVITPVTRAVGKAWEMGDLNIFEEHLYTEVLQNLLRQAMQDYYVTGGHPRVMLTTVPGEQHDLGLLMVEALLRIGGAEVISFGTQMPFKEIIEAAYRHRVEVIGLSFSAAFNTQDAVVMLNGLRQMLDNDIALWVGGAALFDRSDLSAGIDLCQDLSDVEITLRAWRSKHSS